jgi:hypothetical protein
VQLRSFDQPDIDPVKGRARKPNLLSVDLLEQPLASQESRRPLERRNLPDEADDAIALVLDQLKFWAIAQCPRSVATWPRWIEQALPRALRSREVPGAEHDRFDALKADSPAAASRKRLAGGPIGRRDVCGVELLDPNRGIRGHAPSHDAIPHTWAGEQPALEAAERKRDARLATRRDEVKLPSPSAVAE